MNPTNYDIWAIQENKDEIYDAVEGVQSSPTNTLFGNCFSYLRLGKKKINIQFSTAFYSEVSDRLILLRKNGPLTEEEFKKLLEEKQISYNEVQFLETHRKDFKGLKELWFAREPYVLDDALKDSKNKGIDTCDYYPDIKGRFELRYPTKEKQIETIDHQIIHGVVILEDKLVLIINNGDEKNISYKQALKVLRKNDFAPNIHLKKKNLPEQAIPKQYKKEQ